MNIRLLKGPLSVDSGHRGPSCSFNTIPNIVPYEEPMSINFLGKYWVAVKELKLSYYTGETLLFTIYTHYGNLI